MGGTAFLFTAVSGAVCHPPAAVFTVYLFGLLSQFDRGRLFI